jgi:hypothetical protein
MHNKSNSAITSLIAGPKYQETRTFSDSGELKRLGLLSQILEYSFKVAAFIRDPADFWRIG